MQSGVLQIALGIGLLYAWWSGALAVLIEGITDVIRGQPAPGSLFDAATAGRR